MSKELVISIVVLLIIIVANVCVSHFIDGKLNYMIDELEKLEICLSDGRNEDAENKISEIDHYFNESEDVLSCYIEHDELEKVKTEFTSLKAYVRFEKDDAFEALDKIRFIIHYYYCKSSKK